MAYYNLGGPTEYIDVTKLTSGDEKASMGSQQAQEVFAILAKAANVTVPYPVITIRDGVADPVEIAKNMQVFEDKYNFKAPWKTLNPDPVKAPANNLITSVIPFIRQVESVLPAPVTPAVPQPVAAPPMPLVTAPLPQMPAAIPQFEPRQPVQKGVDWMPIAILGAAGVGALLLLTGTRRK